MSVANDDIEHRVTAIEKQLAIIDAYRSVVKIPGHMLALLWAMFIVAMAAVIFIVRLDSRVTDLAQAVQANQVMILNHVEQPWHAAAGEKYKAVDDRVNRLDSRVGELEHTHWSR